MQSPQGDDASLHLLRNPRVRTVLHELDAELRRLGKQKIFYARFIQRPEALTRDRTMSMFVWHKNIVWQ
jgi:hypothetical protein